MTANEHDGIGAPFRPDWSREQKSLVQWYPSRSLLGAIRRYQNATGALGPIRKVLAKWSHRCWSIVTGADIPIDARIAGGLLIPHPNGVVISPQSYIGPNCLLFQQVTIGSDGRGVPTLGAHVDVGAGAKILGAIRIGNFAKIGANAVVLCDVPDHATAIGIPARIIDANRIAPIEEGGGRSSLDRAETRSSAE